MAVLDKIFGSPLHEHADAAQRVIGVGELPPDSKVLVQLLSGDPAAEVRIAAAGRCGDLAALASAARTDPDAGARVAISSALGRLAAASTDVAAVESILAAPDCTEAVRAEVALHAPDEERRKRAIDGIADEAVLVDVAAGATSASTRMAAAERVQSREQLKRLFEALRDKDRGIARLAKQRLDAITHRAEQIAAADVILAQAEALVTQPGPVVMAAVELDRHWKALQLEEDAEHHARWEAIGVRLQERFERENQQHKAQVQLEKRLADWLAALPMPPAPSQLPTVRGEFDALRAEAIEANDAPAIGKLAQLEPKLVQWEQDAPALAAAEALVIEAEQLAEGTPIDDAQLPTRWQALDLAVRTPAMTRRFEAALLVIDKRRQAYLHAAQVEQTNTRQALHDHLHAAEQALAAGQLQEARTAIEAARTLKPAAGTLPKPTVQRMSRVVQQLHDLEKWQTFGQQTAREQLCERAEAMLTQTLSAAVAAKEVQKLRAEWKKLDEQYAGVPKALWERFDSACEKAYAPAAQHFAEMHAQHKEARKQREEFIAAAEAHVPTLLTDPPDWRAIEHWLRDTDQKWRGGDLGSTDPGAWKKLDAKMKEAVAPLRDLLNSARSLAKSDRQALIDAAKALVPKALERDSPSQARDLQAKWQALAKSVPLLQRDERALWDDFRAACNAVFDARKNARGADEERKHEQRKAFDDLCDKLETLARSNGSDDELRRGRHELLEQWKQATASGGSAPGGLEARFRAARAAIDDKLQAGSRAKEAAVWRDLLAKERLCAELDALVIAEKTDPAVVEAVQARWSDVTLNAAWEKKLAARRDQAIAALATASDSDERYDLLDRIDEATAARRDALLELELMLNLDSPRDQQKERLQVQVKHLRERFKRAASDDSGAAEILLGWCVLPGTADARDLERVEKIVGASGRKR
jgi:hypothetical protein